MDFENAPNLLTLFLGSAERLSDRPFLWTKQEGAYAARSWRQIRDEISLIQRGLAALGIGPGDRVALIAENGPKWLIADHAIMACGAIAVPAYTTNTVDDHLHILNNSGAKAAIVADQRLSRTFLPAAHSAPSVEMVVSMVPLDLHQEIGPVVHSWDEVAALGAERPDDLDGAAARIARTDTACIIHTSGTGGAPKGVMLSHGALISNCAGAYHSFRDHIAFDSEVFLCFLPLSHAYEHMAGQFLPIALGAEIYYAEGVEALVANMAEAQPTIMTAVPRLYETMLQRIRTHIRRGGGIGEKLFELAVDLGSKKYETAGDLTFVERILDHLVEVLVRRKVRRRFGGRLKFFVSGGAPLNYDVGLFFTALGVRLLQGYGQTEAAPVISCNPFDRIKLHTVGPPLDGVEVQIAEDGEILVRGELVMQGYWNDADATAATIKDGWLHTGDLGQFDDDGYIQITDRKKDLIVNSGGDNISPQRVEGFLTLQPEISQAMVHGDRRPYLVALIVPDQEAAHEWAQANGKPADLAALVDDDAFQAAIGQAIERVNGELSTIERVRRFVLTSDPFSVENSMMTPTLKIRRHMIREQFGAHLDALYSK